MWRVREVAVVGVPIRSGASGRFALLVVHEGHAWMPGNSGTPQTVRGTGAPQQAGRSRVEIALVTEIPKTSVGKLDKKRIRVDTTEWQANNSTFLSTL